MKSLPMYPKAKVEPQQPDPWVQPGSTETVDHLPVLLGHLWLA